MSEVKVNKISPRTNCGTVQLGDSGDTITIPAGATITNNGTQTGFGRTGTVDWQTSIKTSSFTAVSGEGYFCNTTSGAFTVTLPASPSVGDIVAVKDYASTFDTNNLTIGRNSSNIEGTADDRVLETESLSITFVYADATKGWLAVNDMAATQATTFIAATGGTVTTCGDFKIHTFTSPGSFCVSCGGSPFGSNTVDYLVVAGGGGAGGDAGGGGGAGGVRFASTTFSMPTAPANPRAGASAITVSAQAYPITVGGGGAGTSPGNGQPNGTSGSNSQFSNITSAGGGGGGGGVPENGANGGSGGGSRANNCSATAGSGNTPSVSPSQGQPGGGTGAAPWGGAGGGGGFMVTGSTGSAGPSGGPGGSGGGTGGNGGGFPTAFGSNGESSGGFRYYAGGGGGGSGPAADAPTTPGGLGGGGNATGPGGAKDGTANTGGGGGGGAGNDVGGGAGGSGIVVIRYKFQ